MIYRSYINTPLGDMVVCGNDVGICLLEFTDRTHFEQQMKKVQKHFKSEIIEKDLPIFHKVSVQLQEYFDKKRTTFDIPLMFLGTPFQKEVWDILLRIPYGETYSYKQQAKMLGDEKKVRAVANANAKNKIAIIVPCHRVIGTNGKLTGYAGGVWRKEELLNIEESMCIK